MQVKDNYVDNELLEQIYNSYNFKRNTMNIINLYVNNFITFEDVIKGIATEILVRLN